MLLRFPAFLFSQCHQLQFSRTAHKYFVASVLIQLPGLFIDTNAVLFEKQLDIKVITLMNILSHKLSLQLCLINVDYVRKRQVAFQMRRFCTIFVEFLRTNDLLELLLLSCYRSQKDRNCKSLGKNILYIYIYTETVCCYYIVILVLQIKKYYIATDTV